MIRKALEVPSNPPSAEVFCPPGPGFGGKGLGSPDTREVTVKDGGRVTGIGNSPETQEFLHLLGLTSRGGRWYRNRLRA